jgi:dTDP-glucose 4,6-dehydratase
VKTRVLLTGIAGFVGSHIVEHIQAETDWEVVGLASFRHLGDPLRTEAFGPRVSLFTADLTAPLSPRLVDLLGPIDFIINAAAESHVDRSIAEPRHFIENNVSVAITMLEYARLIKPKAFLQISTDEVYGPAEPGQDFAEWSRIVPSNPYSASKAAQEAISISYWRTYDVPVVITNAMNMFGERQDAEKMVPLCIRAIHRGDVVSIHGTPELIGSRSYLHARNHADALLHILHRKPARFGFPGALPDRYNIAGDQELDNLALAMLIAEIMDRPLLWEFVDFHATRPGHDLRYALDGTRLRGTGWAPKLDLKTSLERTIRWTLSHPEWLL